MSSPEVTSTFDRPYRPAAIALANRVGRLLSGVGIGSGPITVASVLSDARRKAGLSNLATRALSSRSRCWSTRSIERLR